MPTRAQRSRRNCRQKICHGERPMSSFGRMAPGTNSVSTSSCSTNSSSLPRPGRVPVVPGASSDPWSSPDTSFGRSSLTGADDRPLRATRQSTDAGSCRSEGVERGDSRQESAICRPSSSGARRHPRIKDAEPWKDLRAEQLAQRALRACSFAEGRRSVGTHRPSAHDQRHRFGRVRLPQARRRVVGRHRHDRVRAETWEHLAEERPVDGRDHVALVLGPAVVRRHVGALDVDVQAPGSRRARRRRGAPTRRTAPRPPLRSPSRRAGERRPAACRARSRCLVRPASRRSTPTSCRTDRRWVAGAGRWSPPSRVRMRLPGSFPASRRRALISLASRMRADPSTNAFVRSAARIAPGAGPSATAVATTRLERLERDPERAPAFVRRVGVRDAPPTARRRRRRGSPAPRGARSSPAARSAPPAAAGCAFTSSASACASSLERSRPTRRSTISGQSAVAKLMR